MADLAELCNGLALTDKESALFDFDLEHVVFSPSDPKEQQWILAVTVLRHTKFNVGAMERTLKGIWKPFKGVVMEVIDDNLFAFIFNHENDMKRVLAGCPWHFENSLVLVKQVMTLAEIKREDLFLCPFWIRILELSPNRISEEKAEQLGSMIGNFMEYDSGGKHVKYSGYIRVRVEIDTSQSIRRGILVGSKESSRWLKLQYEKLPKYCFWCGGFDHVERECEVAFDDGAKEGDKRQFAGLTAEESFVPSTKVANSQRWSSS